MENQRDIFLIEADFNVGNKIYFGSIMIKQATSHGLVPQEQHGLRDHNCLEVVHTKTFFDDRTRQKLLAAAKGSF